MPKKPSDQEEDNYYDAREVREGVGSMSVTNNNNNNNSSSSRIRINARNSAASGDTKLKQMTSDDSDEDEESSSSSFFSSSSSSSGSTPISWITWFCNIPGHEYFVEVPEEFIEDDFNLTGLPTVVPMFTEALDTILDLEFETTPDVDEMALIEESSELLYGLIHQRYILTKQGLEMMNEKFRNGHFGACPRYLCSKPCVLPVGQFDKPGNESVKLYCSRCLDIYNPREVKFSSIDGAFFGSTFPHLFFLTYPSLIPPIGSDSENDLDEYEIYTPRIFGFRVNERSYSGPSMSWLRYRKGLDKPKFLLDNAHIRAKEEEDNNNIEYEEESFRED